jgi:hypothetical protein
VVPDEYEQALPRYSGMYGYRAIMDMEDLVEAVGDDRARVATIYVGQGAYAITYPIMRAEKVNVGLYILNPKWESEAWVRPADKSDMHRDLSYMGQHVNAIMDVSFLESGVARHMETDMSRTCWTHHNGQYLKPAIYPPIEDPELLSSEMLPMPRHLTKGLEQDRPSKMLTFL